MKREGISKGKRFKVFERDGFMCQYCGRDPINFDIVLEVDHGISIRDGGSNDIDNLITSCLDCNRGKGRNSTIIGKLTSIQEEKDKLLKAKERLVQVKMIKEIRHNKKNIIDEINNEKFGFIEEKLGGYSGGLIKTMNVAIKGKHGKGMDLELLEECLDITLDKFMQFKEFYTNDFVKYFYGVLRNKI